MKRALIIASVASMIDQFNLPNIELLQKLEYKVDVACNFKKGNTCTNQRLEELREELLCKGVGVYHIDFDRNVFNLLSVCRAYEQVDKIIKKNKYDFIHCHTPIGGVIGRIAGHHNGIKVIYTAHGFHFFKGSKLSSWILFYPVERLMANFTDILLVINKEDYRLAKKWKSLKENKVILLPGVGLDTKKFADTRINRGEMCKELGISPDKFILLSVGELHKRKNHIVVLKALKKLNNKNIVYIMVGNGQLEKEYRRKIKEYGLERQVIMTGNRRDIPQLCQLADCFVHPSVREGLGIAPLEAMAAGKPLISAYVNGIKDYTKNGVTGICVNPKSVDEMADAIRRMFSDEELRVKCGNVNKKIAKRYDIAKTNEVMEKVYTYV
jgi:glycosyltransferase involved in cell wall biosynthesis